MVTPLEETPLEAELRRLAGAVPDPELPVLTLEELGVLRAVHTLGPGRVEVELSPTYTGCPAIESMSADIERVLHEHGIPDVTVRPVLAPAWSTDDISPEGRRKLKEFGIAPPRTTRTPAGPVTVALGPTRHTTHPTAAPATDPAHEAIACPHCGSTDTELLSRFSSTACKALRRCLACREPFDHFKEL
ncbi:1,2-phenylacetyl-CoA epoxidase subunit PaaD [Streptomyces sp. VRA16 Mangrove soil]|uniref:1,2-phenylacetyl-CoA epoxidase subunit PaaD n=1 Tax=Streptomyces sp. VRA16 Mangrove soil TaxID=2817434 RepID=UPI001A9EB5BE|nr:1,2-phenylacetyl-CoA epoxidase subunit PaaD [Streptomyces sp. VRA16 Mangrove soil]MBO1333513.1 phenylacetate-CoA oxygenase subunit PaaJ [Streptomyces sp. VRA16 Mangrove soil]